MEGRRRGEREENFTLYAELHMLLHVGEALLTEGLFLRRLTRRARAARPRKTSFTSRNATCGDNSIVHFIRSAALRYKHAYPLSRSSAGIKLATGGREKGAEEGEILYRCREDYER